MYSEKRSIAWLIERDKITPEVGNFHSSTVSVRGHFPEWKNSLSTKTTKTCTWFLCLEIQRHRSLEFGSSRNNDRIHWNKEVIS